MAASLAFTCKSAVLLAVVLVAVCDPEKCPGGDKSCNYPKACTRPSTSDRNHLVDTTAIYNTTTMQCEDTGPVSAPRDCKKFRTLDDCQLCCGNANVTET